MEEKTSIGSVIATIIIIALIVLGGLYFWGKRIEQQQAAQSFTPATTTEGVPSDNSNTATTTTNWKTYSNTQYGFDLTFTDAWKGYKVFSSEGSQGVGAPTYLDFSLPTADKTQSVQNVTDEVFGYVVPLEITIIAKDRAYQGTGIKITEDNNNAYYYTINKNLPADLQKTKLDIPGIISTFKFTK